MHDSRCTSMVHSQEMARPRHNSLRPLSPLSLQNHAWLRSLTCRLMVQSRSRTLSSTGDHIWIVGVWRIVSQLKKKLKLHHYKLRRRMGERRYSSYSFSTLDGVSGQRHVPPRFRPRERTPGTHCTGGWVGPRAVVWTQRLEEKSFVPAGDRTSMIQSVVRHYTDNLRFNYKEWLH
jgi:hypothetical protein